MLRSTSAAPLSYPSSSSIGPRYRASLHASAIAIYSDSHIDVATSFYNLDY